MAQAFRHLIFLIRLPVWRRTTHFSGKGEVSERAKRPAMPFMTDRLKPFSTDELAGLLFTLDIAATVDPLVPDAKQSD